MANYPFCLFTGRPLSYTEPACRAFAEQLRALFSREPANLKQSFCFELHFIPVVCRLDDNVLSDLEADLFFWECYDKPRSSGNKT